MRMLVLGAGLQGCACAYDLCQVSAVKKVTIADLRAQKLPAFLQPYLGKKLDLVALDVTDTAALKAAMNGHDAVMSAIPYYYNEPIARAAVEVGIHFCDLGGNTEIVFQQKRLHEVALAKGVSVIPDCGVAPGMVNILAAEGIRRLDQVDRVKIYVGGLPQHPEPPLNYQIVYSLEGALDYYSTPSWVLRDGKRTQVEALTELETLEFPAPVGTLEAFHTAGGISTLPWSWEGKMQVMEYKTLRYPGHAYIMKAIRDLGLIDLAPIEVKGARVVPRDVFIAVGAAASLQAGRPRPAGAPRHRQRDKGRQAGSRHLPAAGFLRYEEEDQRHDAHHRLLAGDHRPHAGRRTGQGQGRPYPGRGHAVQGVCGGAGEAGSGDKGTLEAGRIR